MKKKKILFVTYREEKLEDVCIYATELAKMMDKNLAVMFLSSNGERERWDDVIMVAALAEADMRDTARDMMKKVVGVDKVNDAHPDKKLVQFMGDCTKSGINLEVYTTKMTLYSAMKKIMKKDHDIDFVMLSPEVSRNENSKEGLLSRLVQTVSKPFVTMIKRPGPDFVSK